VHWPTWCRLRLQASEVGPLSGSAAGGFGPSRRWAWAVAGIGVVASLPLVLLGFPHPTIDGICYLQWAENFSAQFWQGELYPRWLRDLNHGLGSPVFFYYPPLSFWVAALLQPLATASLSSWQTLGWASALAVVASGLAAWVWLRGMVGSVQALVGAVAYMLAPYRVALTLLERGGYPEHCAFVWMPLVLWGIQRQHLRLPSGWVCTALAFAGFFLTHTPTTVTFTPLAVLYALGMSWRTAWATVGAGIVGAALAAVYWVPALSTLDWIQPGYWQTPYWMLFFSPKAVLTAPFALADGSQRANLCFLGLVVTVVCLCPSSLCRHAAAAPLRLRRVWWAMAVVVVVLMLPISLWLYDLLWPLRMIQFPWRFLAPGSLIWAGLIALAWPEPTAPAWMRVLHGEVVLITGLMLVALTARAYAATCLAPPLRLGRVPARIDPMGRDVGEYQPASAQTAAARLQMKTNQVLVLRGSAQAKILAWRPRHMTVDVQSDTGAHLLLRQFYYPGWMAQTSQGLVLPLKPDEATGVLSLDVPPGPHTIHLRLKPKLPERLGWAITLAAVLVLGFRTARIHCCRWAIARCHWCRG